METGHKQNDIASGATIDLNSEIKKELIQSSETLSNTKSILESICSDFQNIDVLSPKDKLPKKDLPESKRYSTTHANFNNSTNLSNDIQKPFSNHVETRVSTSTEQSKDNATATYLSVPSKDICLQTSVASHTENIKTVLQQCDLEKSVCVEGNSTKEFISSSLAELADAEIVQSDGNVSIVITNPRLIQVLNSEDGGQYQTVGVVEQVASPTVPVVTETSVAIQQDVTFPNEINEVAELVVCEGGEGPRKESPKKRKYKLSSSSKGKAKASSFKQKTVSGKMTKARRISAKMKTEWAKTLAKKGSLVCPMQGCYQKYVTIANFLTHYKFCPGQRELKPCPYCSSLIFSEKQAVLHHMQVEHPDKVEEYKANVSDDESSDHYEEEIVLKPAVKVEKRKTCYTMSKENQSPKGKKHKIFKSIAHESEIESIKEFRKCVRFDNIVSKINSCDQSNSSESLETSVTPSSLKSPKDRRKRLIVTGKIVEEEKYFEDADEFLKVEPKIEDTNFKLNTKSRLVLNLERYKQFNQHLKLTRDWSSARKTYSRSRISESSFDISCTSVQNITDLPQDVHQLDDLCLQNTTNEDGSEVIYYADVPKELSEFDLESTKGIKKTRPSLISQSNSARKRVGILKEKIENAKEIEPLSPIKPTAFSTPNSDKPLNGLVLKEKKVPCYLRDSIANATSTPKDSPEVTRKPVATKMGAIITYGKNIPVSEEKKIKTEKMPVVDFDTLFKNSVKEMKLLREKSSVENVIEMKQEGKHVEANEAKVVKNNKVKLGKNNKVKRAKGVKHTQLNESKHVKENGIKEPEKRKRGRPRKQTVIQESELPESSLNQKNEVVVEKQSLEAAFSDAKAKNLKHSRARAYIKCQRQKSIRNLNLRRLNRIHMAVVPDPSITSSDNLEQEEICNNISQEMSEAGNNLTKKQMHPTEKETENKNSCTSFEENLQSEVEKNSLNQNLDPNESTPEPHIQTDECNKVKAHFSGDVNVEKSATLIPEEDSSILNAEIKPNENKAELEISTKSNHEANLDKPSCDLPTAKECPVEPQQVPSSCSKEIRNDTSASNENSSQILEISQPVKRRRGRPKKISNLKATPLVEAVSNQDLHSNSVQPNDVHFDIKQNETIQSATTSGTEPVKSHAAQTDVANQSDVVQLETVNASVVQSGTEKTEVIQSEAPQSASEKPAVSDENMPGSTNSNIDKTEKKLVTNLAISAHSAAVQPNTDQAKVVHCVTEKTEATQSEAEKTEATRSEAEKTEATQSVADKIEASQSSTKQTEAVQSDVANTVAEESKMPVRKSLRSKKRKVSSSNDDFVFLPTSKKEFDALTSLEEEQITPVKTGRRGRPRKYPLKTDLDLPAKGIVEEMVADKELSEHLINPTEIAPDSSVELVTVKTGKRGRPRKIPLSELNSSVTESDNSMVRTELPNAVPEGTRRRGRPRKHPLKPEFNSSNEVTNSPNLSQSLNDSSISNKSLRKCPRKGRPMKCVHFEALNSQTDTSSTVEIASEKKPETKLENNEMEINVTNSANLLNNKDSADKVSLKPEKLILPPKKRKIADENEVLPVNKEKLTRKSADDPDYSAVEDISEEESDFEQPRKAKKSDLDLPYKPGKKKSKKMTKKSHSLSFKKVAATPTKPNLQFLFDFTGTIYEEKELYPNYKPRQSMFTSLIDWEWQECLPSVDSISIKIETAENKNDWMKLKCFESVSNEAFKNFTFFVGGPVTTSAFCPTPRNMICDQYIALATNYSLLNIHYASTKPQRGLIQFYNLGNLQSTVLPVLELALCHQNATITDMQWCPRGCYEEPSVPPNQDSNSDRLPRLGLLAVASADSFVRIYSVPHPKYLNDWGNNSLPFFNSSPSVILEPMNGSTRSSIATSLTWADAEDCEQIAVGYGNGMVCIWLVNTTNSILLSREDTRVKTIIPYLVFQAHGTPVTSLQFAPLQNCRYLVSSGFDKTLKFFDLMDTSMPFCSAKRGCAINCQWSSSLCGAYVSLHDGITFKGSNYFKDSGTEEFPAQNISGTISSLTQSRVSDTINALATADMKGAVSVKCLNKSMLCGSESARLPPSSTYKIFKTEVTSLQNSIKNELTDVISSISNMQDVIDVTMELASEVETAIDSENKRVLESSVSELMDEILSVTVENNLKSLETSPTQTNDSCISETEVTILLSSLCEATANLVNLEAEKSAHLGFEVKSKDTSSTVGDNLPSEIDNMDSQSKKHSSVSESDATQTAVSLTDSHTLNKSSDCLERISESSHLSDEPGVPCRVSEILPAHPPESDDSVSEKVLEVTDESTGICNSDMTSDEKNLLPTTSSGVSDDYYSQETSEAIDLSDDDSFSSEDNDSEKDTDMAFDAESNFSDDSMMSECSLSSKSESSYSSYNAMDESMSMDYIDELNTYSPEPKDTVLVDDCLKNSDLECSSAPNDLLSTNNCLKNSEPTAPVEDYLNSEQEGSGEPHVSLLSEKCIQTQETSTTSNDLPMTETNVLLSTEVSPSNGVCASSGECVSNNKEASTSDCLPSNLTNSTENSINSFGVESCSGEDSEQVNASEKCDSSQRDTPLKDPTSKNVESPVCQFYEQHTRTSKPFMQSLKSASEACTNNTENENSICETGVKVGNEACIDSCATYENIISSHGVIFTDMFLDSKDDSNLGNGDEMEKLPSLELNNFSSVNTISWNPNHGYEYWLFTAGNSGIARLCCVSNINVTDHASHHKDT